MARDRADHYTRKAHSLGYPARSVFKLEEIDQKNRILRRGANVLDLGAAPGSWTRYAARIVGADGKVVAVDLNELNVPNLSPNVRTIAGDIFEPETIRTIRESAPYDVILSDAAPSTTGNRTVDTARSVALVERALELSRELLRNGGNMVAKLFQGGDERRLLEEFRNRFASAKIVKPKASRKESFETFLVGIGSTQDPRA